MFNWETWRCYLTLSRTFFRPAAAAAAAADDDGCDAISVLRMSSSAALAREDHWRHKICGCRFDLSVPVSRSKSVKPSCSETRANARMWTLTVNCESQTNRHSQRSTKCRLLGKQPQLTFLHPLTTFAFLAPLTSYTDVNMNAGVFWETDNRIIRPWVLVTNGTVTSEIFVSLFKER